MGSGDRRHRPGRGRADASFASFARFQSKFCKVSWLRRTLRNSFLKVKTISVSEVGDSGAGAGGIVDFVDQTVFS